MEITPANAMDVEYLTDEQVYRFSTIAALRRLGFPLHGDAALMEVDEQVDIDEIVIAVRKEGALMMQERAALGGPPAADLGSKLNAIQITQILIHVFGALRIVDNANQHYVTFMYDFRYGSYYPHGHAAVMEMVDQVLGGCLDEDDDGLFNALSSHTRRFRHIDDLPGENAFLRYVIMHEFDLTDAQDDEDEGTEEGELDLELLDDSQLELALHPQDEAYLEEVGRTYFEEEGIDEH